MLHFLHHNFQGKPGRFLKWHLGATVVFAILYKVFDEFMSDFPVEAESIGLGETVPPADTFLYWIWFSLVTQSTVGYGGPETSKGRGVPFSRIRNNAYKALNLLQLISIFAITAHLIK